MNPIPPLSVIGIGTDIIEIQRIKDSIQKHKNRFLHRIFTENERAYCKKFSDPFPHLAGRFACKEAVIKAIGSIWHQPIGWHQIEIRNQPLGKPEVFFLPPLEEIFQGFCVLVTLSHCKMYATATALLCKNLA